jgi:hypothetical protein
MTDTFSRSDLANYGKEQPANETGDEAAADADAGADKTDDTSAARAEHTERAPAEHPEAPASVRTKSTTEDRVQFMPIEPLPPMPDLGDSDINFDNDLYRTKMQEWTKKNARNQAAAVVNEELLHANVTSHVAQARTLYKDFDAVVTNNPVLKANQLAPDAGLAVARSPYVVDALYYFGKNLWEAVRVSKLSPAEQLIAVGELLARIKQAKRGGTSVHQGQGQRQSNSISNRASPTRSGPPSRESEMNESPEEMRKRGNARRPRGWK